MFSTLELSAITNLTGLKMNCNITGLQMFEPNNLKINALIAGLNLKRKFEKKTFLNYAPVSFEISYSKNLLIIYIFIECCYIYLWFFNFFYNCSQKI